MNEIYKIEIHDELSAESVEEVFENFKSRLQNKETTVCIEHIESGEKYFIELQSGDLLSMKP
jgi:hypothetical protein